MSCELETLNRVASPPTEPMPPCTHWPRKTLAEELLELDAIERKNP
jgi:hypothetical protein